MKKFVLVSMAAAMLVGRAAAALADEPPPHKFLGVGYKIGNGMGVIGGDVIISPIDHLTFDLQANYFAEAGAAGYGLVPMLQVHLFSGQVSSPYLGAGVLYATLSMDNVTASATGVVANAGYEWRWASGLGILLGGGINHLGNIHATDGVTTVDAPGVTQFNIEAGLRFMFL